MYEAHFRFTDRPFSAAPSPGRYFGGHAIEQARQTITRATERAEGPAMLIGPAGVGKTLLLHVLANQLRSQLRVVILTGANLTSQRALLQTILFELNLPYRGMEEGELRLALMDVLQPSSSSPHGMLLLVDEAHHLSLRLLEDLRLMTNIVRQGEPRVRLVIAGSPTLEELFTDPKLDSFNQRLAARCYLHAFDRDETCRYVAAQIAHVGGQVRRVMTEDALHAVYRATDGIPRLINQVCDHALMLASLGGRSQLNASGIEEAWADLQQLPMPWQERAATGSEPGNVIEFGELEDEQGAKSAPPQHHLASHSSRPARPAADSQLDDIQLKVAQIESEETASTRGHSARPTSCTQPEVELLFHHAHDPFGEPFEEEEVVIDHYATLDAGGWKQRPQVTSQEGLEIAEALQQRSSVAPAAQQPVHEQKPSDTGSSERTAAATYDVQYSSASDNWQAVIAPLWNEAELSDAPAREAAPEAAPQIVHDDSDLIIIEEDALGQSGRGSSNAAPRRHDYRQLFARLRRD